jgi:hypothetical protein
VDFQVTYRVEGVEPVTEILSTPPPVELHPEVLALIGTAIVERRS